MVLPTFLCLNPPLLSFDKVFSLVISASATVNCFLRAETTALSSSRGEDKVDVERPLVRPVLAKPVDAVSCIVVPTAAPVATMDAPASFSVSTTGLFGASETI